MSLSKSSENAALTIAGLVFFCGLIYGMYWVFKSVSYGLFYEDMVIETIHETVQSKCLLVK